MHSFTSILIHCVWSTKKREPFLSSDVRNRLWPYLGGIARENKIKALAIGGVADHVHMLISLPKTLSVSKALQLLKGNSSKWIHDTFPKFHSFEWQEGYGALQRWYLRGPRHSAVHLRRGGAPSKAIVSRGVRGHASATWLGLRRADARLILPSLPGLVSLLTF